MKLRLMMPALFCVALMAQEGKNQVRLQYLDMDVTADPLRYRVLVQDFFDADTATYVSETDREGIRLSDTLWVKDFFGVDVGVSHLGQGATLVTAEDHPYKIVGEMNSVQAGGVLRWRFFEKLDVFGRFSAAYWREEFSLYDLSPPADETGYVPFDKKLYRRNDQNVETEWELGLTFDISGGFGVTGSVMSSEAGNMEIDFVTIGVSYRY
ncbi:MAG: hypothetical protein KDC35_01180 [Acidobacteria bacterium]|nr:hypothetical protein [Acidobacteriota bacterium]